MRRMPHAARFHPGGIFPAGYIEIAYLQGSVDAQRTVIPYAGDKELHRSAEEVRPFFASLDKRPAYRGDKEKILPSYRALLSGTLKDDIHGHDDLKRFIEKEDAVFRTFMAHLHSFGKVNMSDITRDTEKCCVRIFLAAGRQEITYKEAMIYMTMRTNRRLILNVETCLDDIHRGKSPRRSRHTPISG